jgi:aspartyl-tRNA(Asn)/glutamyl-tRNA(Gln) amidotransferase subunit A
MYMADVYTLPASLAGVSGLSVPIGLTEGRAERPPLPIGLQLLGAPWAEETLFAVAAACEAERPLADLRPPER